VVHFSGATGSDGGVASQPAAASQPEPEPPTIPTRAGKSIGRPPLIIQVKPEDFSILFSGPERRPPSLLPPIRKRGGGGGGQDVVGGGDAESLIPRPMVSGSFTPRWFSSTPLPATLTKLTAQRNNDTDDLGDVSSASDRGTAADRHVFWTQNDRDKGRVVGQHDDDHRLPDDTWTADVDEDSDLIVYGRDADEDSDSDYDNVHTTEIRRDPTSIHNYSDGGEESAGDEKLSSQSDSDNGRGVVISDRGDGGEASFPSAQPVVGIIDTGNATDNDDEQSVPRAEASNDAPANFLVNSGGGAGAPTPEGAAAEKEEGRSLDIARSATGDLGHRIIISQHILRDTPDYGSGGGSSLTLQIGSGGSRGSVLDISNMVAIAVGALGFLLIVCGKHFFCFSTNIWICNCFFTDF
jgi:hypothetical protein